MHGTMNIKLPAATSCCLIYCINMPHSADYLHMLQSSSGKWKMIVVRWNNDSNKSCAGPSGCAVWGVGLRQLACWDRGFESHLGHGCLSVVNVVCCQVEVCASSWSLVQRSPTDCGPFVVYDLETSWMRRPWPTVSCCAKNKQTKQKLHFFSKDPAVSQVLSSSCYKFLQLPSHWS